MSLGHLLKVPKVGVQHTLSSCSLEASLDLFQDTLSPLVPSMPTPHPSMGIQSCPSLTFLPSPHGHPLGPQCDISSQLPLPTRPRQPHDTIYYSGSPSRRALCWPALSLWSATCHQTRCLPPSEARRLTQACCPPDERALQHPRGLILPPGHQEPGPQGHLLHQPDPPGWLPSFTPGATVCRLPLGPTPAELMPRWGQPHRGLLRGPAPELPGPA